MTEHGGNPLNIVGVTDFSANINPLGITEEIRRAFILSADELEKYPDPFCVRLRKKLSERTGASMENIVCGNGADDLIYRIVHAMRPRKALIAAPTFSEYKKALTECDCAVDEYMLREENGFKVTEELLDNIRQEHDMLFLCTPNNPTGRTVSEEILSETAKLCRERGIVLVCDESFQPFTESRGIMPFMNEKVIALRSMTKTYAVPGVRLGYAVFGDKAQAETTARTGQYWSVSAPAQRVGEAALEDTGYLLRSAEYVRREREYLCSVLEGRTEKVYHSEANFILFRAEADFGEKMFEQGILIRDCSNYSGLGEGYFRTAVRTHKENELFADALRRLRNG